MATGDQLLEAVTADTVAHEAARASKHSLPIGTPCPNCHTAIAGPWCYACGQRGEKFHRSIWRLTWEAVEGLTDFDGRIWQTFPRLMLRPARLTRDYLDGHRAARGALARHLPDRAAAGLSPAPGPQGQPTEHQVRHPRHRNPKEYVAERPGRLPGRWRRSCAPSSQSLRPQRPRPGDGSAPRWSRRSASVRSARPLPGGMGGAWFAILMLLIAALMLTILFVFKKGVHVFDHLISRCIPCRSRLLLSVVFGPAQWLAGGRGCCFCRRSISFTTCARPTGSAGTAR